MRRVSVYLLHFDVVTLPYPGAPRRDCAQHYTGRVRGGPRALAKRLAQHGTMRGARLMLARPARGYHLAACPHLARRQRPRTAAQAAGRRRAPLPAVRHRAPVRLPRNAKAACRGRWSLIASSPGRV